MKIVPGTSGPALMSVRTTLAPSFEKSFAASRPMPLDAPVMMQILSFSRMAPPSDDFEVPFQLPAGHRVPELGPLPAPGPDEMIDEGLPEEVARDRRPLEAVRRLGQGAGQAGDGRVLVGASGDRGVLECHLVVEA